MPFGTLTPRAFVARMHTLLVDGTQRSGSGHGASFPPSPEMSTAVQKLYALYHKFLRHQWLGKTDYPQSKFEADALAIKVLDAPEVSTTAPLSGTPGAFVIQVDETGASTSSFTFVASDPPGNDRGPLAAHRSYASPWVKIAQVMNGGNLVVTVSIDSMPAESAGTDFFVSVTNAAGPTLIRFRTEALPATDDSE